MSHPDKGKGFRSESQQQFVKLTDAAVERLELPAGKSQVYLYDTVQPGLALRVRASGGKSWVYLFTKPGCRWHAAQDAGRLAEVQGERRARRRQDRDRRSGAHWRPELPPSAKPNSNSWPQKSGRRWAS